MLHLFWAAPPIARTLAATVFTFSLLVWMDVIPVHYVVFNLDALVRLPPEIWRVLTSFLLTGPAIGMLFDTFFLYTYAAKLEIASPRFSLRADFFTYIVIVCFVILGLNILLTFLIVGGTHFVSPLWLAFVCTSTKDNWGQKTTFIFVEIPLQYLPYAFLFISLLLSGIPSTLIFGTGFTAAHIYDWITGLYPTWGNDKNLLPTPDFVKGLFGSQTVTVRPYGTAIQGINGNGVSTANVWGLSWAKRGPGRRLGGEGDIVVEPERPKGLVLAVMVMGGFLAVGSALGLLFLWHRDPEGWWDTVKSILGVGGVSGGENAAA